MQFDAVHPFDPRDSVVSGDNQPHWRAMSCGQRLAVHLITEHDIVLHGIRQGQAAGEILGILTAADLLDTMVGGEENDLDRLRLHAARFEQRRKPGSRPPGVADQTSRRPVTGALECRRVLFGRARFQLVQRNRARLLDQSADFQLPVGGVHFRHAVVRDGKEMLAGSDPGRQLVPRHIGLFRIEGLGIEEGDDLLVRAP